jgi:WD40 repeat protein
MYNGQIVSASTDKTVAVWTDVTSTKPNYLKLLKVHTDPVANVTTLRGHLVSASANKVAFSQWNHEVCYLSQTLADECQF